MAASARKGRFDESRSTSITPSQQFQFGTYHVGALPEPGVRLRFTNSSGGYNNKSSHTLTLPQLAGLVEVAATDIPDELRIRMIAVLAGVRFNTPHRLVREDAERWE